MVGFNVVVRTEDTKNLIPFLYPRSTVFSFQLQWFVIFGCKVLLYTVKRVSKTIGDIKSCSLTGMYFQ